MVQTFASPGVVHLCYFSELDEGNLKKIWDSCRTACRLNSEVAEDIFKEKRAKSAIHYIQSVGNEKLGIYLFKTRNIHIFEFVMSAEDGSKNLVELWKEKLTQVEEFRASLSGVSGTIFGEATVLLGDTAIDNAEDAWRSLGAKADSGEWPAGEDLQKTEFHGGSLLSLSSESEDKRDYYIYFPRDPAHTGRFLLEQLPLIDSGIQRLQVETGYFLEQSRAIEKERKEADKAIDSILHQGVIVDGEAGVNLDHLRKQVKELSRLYGVLAEGSIITKNAFHGLKNDISLLEQQLETLIGQNEGHRSFKKGCFSTFNTRLDLLNRQKDLQDHSLENARAALDIVRSRVDLEQSTQSLAVQDHTSRLLDQNVILQKEGISLQVAAVFIEFVVVFYYSLHSWEILARAEVFHHIPAVVQFLAILAFTSSVILCTHFAAKRIEKPGATHTGLWLSLLAIFLSFISIIGITLYFSH